MTAVPESVDKVLVVDMANVVGSVPDGWWRDRAGAAARVLTDLAGLVGKEVTDPMGNPIRVTRIVAVLEGQAKRAAAREPGDQRLVIVRADGSGDDTIAQVSADLVTTGEQVLVVTADRGLRARLPDAARTVGPGWLNDLLGLGTAD